MPRPRLTLQPEDAVDLHLHTYASDGRWTPEELTAHLREAGFRMAALADHDTMHSVPEMQARTAEAGIELVPAVEMTTRWENRQVHLLVYGVELGAARTAPFEAVLQLQRDQLTASAEHAVAVIEHHGRRIPSLDAVAMGLPLRPHHVFTAMIRDGHASNLKHAHDIVRSLGEPAMVDVPLADTVAAAQAAGALAIVAHPGRDEGMGILDDAALDRMLATIPIDGVEAHYRSYKDEDTARYRTWAARHGLVVSAGSDSHWPNHPVNPRPHPARWVAALLARLGYEVAPFAEPVWQPEGTASNGQGPASDNQNTPATEQQPESELAAVGAPTASSPPPN